MRQHRPNLLEQLVALAAFAVCALWALASAFLSRFGAPVSHL